MQIISTIALHNHKVPVIIKKTKNFTFSLGESRENFINIFQDLQTKFKDFPGQQKKSRTFPGCGNSEDKTNPLRKPALQFIDWSRGEIAFCTF